MFGAMRRGWPHFWALSACRDRCSGSAFRRTDVFKGGPSPHRERDFAGVGGTFSRERVFRFSGDAHVRALWERSFSGRNLVFSSGSNRIFWKKSSLLQVKTIFSGKNSLSCKVETDFFRGKNFLSYRRPLRRFPSVRRALSLPFGTRGFPCFSWFPPGIPQGCRRKGITSFWPVLKQCLSPYRFNGQARRFIE